MVRKRRTYIKQVLVQVLHAVIGNNLADAGLACQKLNVDPTCQLKQKRQEEKERERDR